MNVRQNDCWTEQIHQEMVKQASRNLWRFLQRNATEQVAREELFLKLAQLSKRDLDLLTGLYLLLSPETMEFLTETAPAILNNLSKTSSHRYRQNSGAVTGPIHWGRTYAARASLGGDRSVFVTSSRTNQFDLPENRVMRYLLQHIYEQTLKIKRMEWDDEVFDEFNDLQKKWEEKIARVYHHCVKLLRNPFLANIEKEHSLTEKQIEQAEKTRGERYSNLAQFARLYQRSMSDPVSYLLERFPQTILEPLNWDTLYEIAVLFKIIESVEELGWKENKVGLIGNGSNVISHLQRGDQELSVYYQSIPGSFDQASKYRGLMRVYGLSDRSRRPDIVLEWKDGGRVSHYCIIEIKRSQSRKYLADGVYKLFGYLHDFETPLRESGLIQAFLVGWSGIKDTAPVPFQGVHVTSWERITKDFQELFHTTMGV